MDINMDQARDFSQKVDILHKLVDDKAMFSDKLINDKLEVVGKNGFFGKMAVVILKIVTLGFYHVKRPHLRADNVAHKLLTELNAHAAAFKITPNFDESQKMLNKFSKIISKATYIINVLEEKTGTKYTTGTKFAKEGIANLRTQKEETVTYYFEADKLQKEKDLKKFEEATKNNPNIVNDIKAKKQRLENPTLVQKTTDVVVETTKGLFNTITLGIFKK